MNTHLTLHMLALALAVLCFASFTWSIFGFFHQEGGMPSKMRLISATGLLSMIVHSLGLASLPSPSIWRLIVGTGGYLASATLFWWALRTAWEPRLAIAFSDATSPMILQDGPYRRIRHPIYLAYALAWIFGAVTIAKWWAWVPVVVMGYQYTVAIRLEEQQFLAGPLASQYRAYIAATGMLIPNLAKTCRHG